MSSRSLIPVFLVAAVVFACGPRGHADTAAKKDSTIIAQSGGPVTLAAARPADDRAAQSATRAPRTTSIPSRSKSAVEAQLYVRATESSVRLALHVVNTSKRRIELTFPSGQTYDFVILDSLGREVWRWGKGRMFTQTLRNKLLGRGESLEVEETLRNTTLEAGRYVARGTLTSQNYPVVEEAEFTIDVPVLATR